MNRKDENMSVVIKQNTIAFRDQDGKFHYANTLAEQNSNELKTKVANLESRVAALEAAKTSTTSETT